MFFLKIMNQFIYSDSCNSVRLYLVYIRQIKCIFVSLQDSIFRLFLEKISKQIQWLSTQGSQTLGNRQSVRCCLVKSNAQTQFSGFLILFLFFTEDSDVSFGSLNILFYKPRNAWFRLELYQFTITAVTNVYKLSGLKQFKFIILQLQC